MHKSRGQTHDRFAEISRAIALRTFSNGGRYLRTFQWEISSPRTQVSFQFFAICIILNIYKRFMLKKLGNKNKNFRRSSTLRLGISFLSLQMILFLIFSLSEGVSSVCISISSHLLHTNKADSEVRPLHWSSP